MEEELVGPTKPVERIKRQVEEILESQGLQSTWPDVLALRNDKTINEEAECAVIAYMHAHLLLEKMAKSKEAKEAVYNALIMLDAVEHLNYLGFLPDIKRGKKAYSSLKYAHDVLYGTDDEKKVRWGKFQLDLDEIHKKRPEIKSYRQLCIWVAEKHNVCVRTIQRHTKNPIKK